MANNDHLSEAARAAIENAGKPKGENVTPLPAKPFELDKVIHLSFKSPHMESDTMAFIACKNCRNKTYTLTEDKLDTFPLMRCAACGQHMGRMGWAHDDDPMLR